MLVVQPERFVAGGEALARDAEGRIVFVRGGVPGDEVAVEITERKGDWSRGHVTDVVTPSPVRVMPPCPHRRAGCGGCDWQHVEPGGQMIHKLAVVVDALRRTARLPDARVVAGASVAPWGYRTTVRLVGDEQRRPAYRKERSNDTEPATGCPIAHPRLVELIDAIRIDPGVEVTLRISAATGAATAVWDRAAGNVDGLPADVATGPSATIDERVAGHTFRVSAGSFFQSGPQAAELLVDAVRRAAPELESARRLLDAYAGVGLFAATVAPREAALVAIESSKWATGDSRANLSGRQVRIERQEVGRWRPLPSERFDVVIADPARTGLGKPGTEALAAAGAEVFVLVSCDPVSLARDTTLLASHGYHHERTEVLDLFPQTHHVEAVTRFVRTLPESSP